MDLTLILNTKYKGSYWTLDGDDYSGLTWLSDSPKPTKKTLEDLWPAVVLEVKAEAQAKIDKKNELLTRLGITADEAALLIS
jgi:hypothetical protein